MYVSDVVKEVGKDQRQRVLGKINAPASGSGNERAQSELEDVDELFEELEKDTGTGKEGPGRFTIGKISNAGSTPPRPHPTSHNNHDNDDDDDNWLLFSIHGNGNNNNSGGGHGGDGEGGEKGTDAQWTEDREAHNHTQEFILVKSWNIDMNKFTGEINFKLSYLEFKDSQRELVAIKGVDGDILNKILTWDERRGDKIITDDQLERLEERIPQIWQCNKAIRAAFKIWTDGDAKRFIKYEVKMGIDAWRKMYIEYIPMAHTRQDIILADILELQPLTDKQVRQFFNRLDEHRYKYNQCGSQPFGENIVRRVIVKCMPKDIIKPLALHFEIARTFQQI